MRRTLSIIFTLLWLLVGAAERSKAEALYAITTAAVGGGQSLFSFDSATPGTISPLLPITGLSQPTETIVGMDFRPLTGQLYAFGSTGIGPRLYTIDTMTGAATLVAAAGIGIAAGSSVDFNPVTDRLRTLSGFGPFQPNQNRQFDPDTGETVLDGTVRYAPGDPSAGVGFVILSGAAYTNNYAGATSTTLYGIEASADVLVTIDPDNEGVMRTIGQTTGNLSGFSVLALTSPV